MWKFQIFLYPIKYKCCQVKQQREVLTGFEEWDSPTAAGRTGICREATVNLPLSMAPCLHLTLQHHCDKTTLNTLNLDTK